MKAARFLVILLVVCLGFAGFLQSAARAQGRKEAQPVESAKEPQPAKPLKLLPETIKMPAAVEGAFSEFDIESRVPTLWRERLFLLENWQWVFLAALVILGLLLDRAVRMLVGAVLRAWFRRISLEQALPRVERTSRPFGFLAAFAFWWVAIGWSALPMSTLQALTAMLKFLTAIGMVWCVYRAVDIVSAFLERQAARTDTALDEMLAAFIRGSLRVVVVAFGVLFILSNIGLNVNSLIAGIGIGGIAVALAAKDPLENLLAGITLLLERPFQVGDLVVVGETRGTIEEMGLRSTRLRTFENTLVTLPNAEMMRGKLDNFQKRKVRRVRATISVTYSTPPDKIEAFCEGIREIIRAHPYTAKDKYHVWFNQFGPSSLDILVFCGLTAGDWATELRERHRLFLDIMRLAQELGVEFAYPTQTIYVAQPKEHAPIFPEEGTILAANEPRLRAVRDKAREIVRSEVGGEGVIPDPVGYDTVIGTTHTPSADSF